MSVRTTFAAIAVLAFATPVFAQTAPSADPVAAAAAAAVVAPVAGEAQATESRSDARKARYRETDHVRRFYATNRY